MPRFLVVLALVVPFQLAMSDPIDRSAILDGLQTLGLDEGDTRLPIDPMLTDPFRLSVVDSVLARPLTLTTVVADLASVSDAFASAPSRLLDTAGDLYADWNRPALDTELDHVDMSEMLALATSLEDAGAPESQVQLVTQLFEACLLTAAYDVGLDATLLSDALDQLRDEDDDAADATPFERRADERAAIRDANRFYARAERIDVANLLEIRSPVVAAVEAVVNAQGSVPDASRFAGWIPFRWESEHGSLVVGTPGDDRHRGDALLLIEPGGNDHYVDGAGGTGMGRASAAIAIDFAGDDVYGSSGPGTLAAGVGGVGIVVDLGGDDIYRAGDVGLGAGVLGMGLLIDRGGDDIYEGGDFGQGAALLGLGVLLDDGGSDLYRLAAYGQGFGSVGGLGVLRDYGGGDRYLARPAHVDVLRYEDHHISFLQGAAFGSRPDRSGGIGLLIDDEGNDLYSSDIFGQGVAYWFGIGALLDRGGHDVYAGYQYSQGAGVHLAAGLLHDVGGDDLYHVKSVSQGCGHDLAPGFLIDEAGNDSYMAVDLAQGAGSANGFGLLADGAGEDIFAVRSTAKSLGYGNPRRGTGSIGLFLDLTGKDAYAQGGEDGGVWWGSRIGAGLDWPGEMTAEEAWPSPARVPVEQRTYTDEELFVLASTGPPKFADLKTFGTDELAARGAAAMPTLLRYFNSKIPRERHGLKDVCQEMGSVCVPFLASVLDTGTVDSRRTAAWCLGYVGSADALPPLTRLYDHAEPSIRTTAAMAVARTVRSDTTAVDRVDVASLQALLFDPDANVRRAATFAIGSLRRESLAAVLVEQLDDPFFSVRVSAVDGLRAVSPGAVSLLVARAAEPGDGRSWALMALGSVDDPSAADGLLSLVDGSDAWPLEARLALARGLHAYRGHPGVDASLRRLATDPDWRIAALGRQAGE